MKKILALALSAALFICAFTACSPKEGDSSSQPESKRYDVADILSSIEAEVSVSNPADVGEDYMTWLGISPEMYTSYAGRYCSVAPGVDIILVVEARDGHAEEVKSAMEARISALVGENSNYDEFLAKKAENGRVVEKGNYLVLAIAGDAETVEEIESAYETVDSAIDEAFK